MVEEGFEIVNDDTSTPDDNSYAVVKQSGGLPKFFKFSKIWDWIQSKVTPQINSALIDVHKKIGEFGNPATSPEHYYKISGFKNITNNNYADMATITVQTRYTARLRINAIAYYTAPSYAVRADLEDNNFPSTCSYQIKYDISSKEFNIYVKAISGVAGAVYANRHLFFLENRTAGANELKVTEVTESDFNNAQYTCTINKVVKEADLSGCTFSINDNVLSITNGTKTWTLISN